MFAQSFRRTLLHPDNLPQGVASEPAHKNFPAEFRPAKVSRQVFSQCTKLMELTAMRFAGTVASLDKIKNPANGSNEFRHSTNFQGLTLPQG
jgi:hypothetical protein